MNSSTNLTFKLYAAPTGGTALWTEAHSAVPVSNGLFNVRLGSRNAIPATVWDNSALYLGLTVGSEAEMSPREQLGAVPAAVRADTALSALAVADGSVKSRGLSLNSGTTCLSSKVDLNMPGNWQSQTILGPLNFTLDRPGKVLVWMDGLAKFGQSTASEVYITLVVDNGSVDGTSVFDPSTVNMLNIKGQRLISLGAGNHSIDLRGVTGNSGILEVWGGNTSNKTCINYLVLGE